MAAPKEAQQWLLANKPTQLPQLSGENATFKLHKAPLPALEDGQVLVKTIHLSNDPAQRTWISGHLRAERLYASPVPLNAPMRAYGIGEVVASKAPALNPGARVRCVIGWQDYAVVPAADCTPLAPLPAGLSDTHYMGSLGLTGLTAYYGLVEVAGTRPTDRVVVSGAAGATGSMAVQIAKHIIGCKQVVGIAGTDAKCRWVESLGADVCVNYRADDFAEQLARATEGFVHVYFDNVGGPILDAMLLRLAAHGRVAACGSISLYNAEGQSEALKNWFQVISNKLLIQGFIVTEAQPRFGEFLEVLQRALADGKIRVDEQSETIVPTRFEDIPKTWMRLFEGQNQGKLVTTLTQ